jgi:hypothetical protein
VDDAAWTALALTLTTVGVAATWLLWRRRGPVAALRGAALTLLVPAAWLTDTLRMFTRIGDAVADWALGLVLSPVVWTGIALAGVSALLLVAASFLARRGVGGSRPARAEVAGQAPAATGPAAGKGRGTPAIDDDLADIEALLRSKGIS